jgi:orotate phosphoribosyltransferase
MKRIEGIGKNVKRVVIIDEVCTTGKSTQEAIDAAVEEGYTVVAVLSLVDREEGGSEQLRAKYSYYSIFTASELLAAEKNDRPANSTGEFSQPARAETTLHK